MKRIATCIIALLSAYNGALAADEAVFIEKGNARSVREMGSKWTCKEGSLVCGGMGNFLLGRKAVAAGDFRIRARLSLQRLGGTAASMVLGGNNFGFDGYGEKLFIEGPAFGQTRMLGDARKFITPGKPFDVEVVRKGTTLSFRIDGKEIHSGAYKLDSVCVIGFRPQRSTMRLYDFSVSGTLTPVTEDMIDRLGAERPDIVVPVRGKGEQLAKMIQVGGVTFDSSSPPKLLVICRDLGLVTAPAVDGRLVHESKRNLFETRATITPGGDYLLMFPEGAHYGGKKGKVNTMIAYRSCDKGKTWTGPKVAFDIDYSQHGFIPLIPPRHETNLRLRYAADRRETRRQGELPDWLPLVGRRRAYMVGRDADSPEEQPRFSGYVGDADVRDRRGHVAVGFARGTVEADP